MVFGLETFTSRLCVTGLNTQVTSTAFLSALPENPVGAVIYICSRQLRVPDQATGAIMTLKEQKPACVLIQRYR